MTLATYEVMVDWDGAGTFGGSADVTSRTMSVEFDRGRDYASQLVGRSLAGNFQAILNNESSDYSPFNSASPIYGSLLPGRKVRFRATADGTVFNLWQGFLNTIQPQPAAKSLNLVMLQAIGPLGYLNRKEVSLPMALSKLTGTLIADILDQANWATADRTLDAGQSTLQRFWLSNLKVMDALRQVEDTEGGFVVETKAGKIAFEDREHRLLSPHTASQGTFSDSGTAILMYSGINQEDPLPNIYNVFQVPVYHYSTGSLQVLWTLAEQGVTSPKLDRGGSNYVIYWMEYPTPDAPKEHIGVDAWTTPVITTDYTGNSSPAGTGVNLSSELSFAVTKYGNYMQVKITNVSGTADVYLTKLQGRGTPVIRDDPVTIYEEDTVSQSKYGRRTYPNPPAWIADTVESLDWARKNLAIYSSPVRIIAFELPANRDLTHLKQALTRDVSDRITIVGNGSAGLGVSQDFFIESEQHRIDASRMHVVTWDCSQAEQYSDFWVLDISALDTQTRLGY